jgi:hypothetical protein
LVPNASASLQTTLAAEAHPAKGHFSLEEQTLDISIEKSLKYRTGNCKITVSKRERQNLE